MRRSLLLMNLLSLAVLCSWAQEQPLVVINEIMYHPISEQDEDEYLELYNAGTESADLSAWYLDGIRYSFPEEVTLGADEFLVIAKDPSTFRQRYGLEALGPYDGVLRNSGETLTLLNREGEIIDQLSYDDREPWPVMADGLGASLECINPHEDNSHPRNWRASHFSTDWNYVEISDTARNDLLLFFLEGEGECLIDNVRIVPNQRLTFQAQEWMTYAMMYRHTPSGNQSLPMHFSHVAIERDQTAPLTQLQLPDHPKIKIFAITLMTPEGEQRLDLTSHFNQDGISYANHRTDGNLDGGGATYAAEELPRDRVIHSEPGIHPEVSWQLGSYADGDNNCISCLGQEITLPPGTYTGVHLLATAVNTSTEYSLLRLQTQNQTYPVNIAVTDWARPLPSDENESNNLVKNGGFERNEAWRLAGSHSSSYVWSGDAQEGSRSLRVISSGESTGVNHSVSQKIEGIETGREYTLSFWYKSLSGTFTLVSKIAGESHLNELPLSGHGTPGHQNSVYSENLPPFVTGISHSPQAPRPEDPVRIMAYVEDLDDIDHVTLLYQIEEGQWQATPMLDTGTQGDEIADDHIYSAVLPPQSSQTLVRYQVHAQDVEEEITQRPYPNQLTPNYGYFVYDADPSSNLPIYWLFLDQSEYQALLANPETDELKRGAFVFEGVLYDNIGIRFRGQWARSWPKKSWKLRFNKDNYFLGRRTVNLNSCYHDRAYIREYLCYRFYREADVYACRSQFAEVRLNGEFYGLELDVEQVNEQFLRDRGFNPDGNLYKSKQNGDLRPFGSVRAYQGPFEKKTNEDEEWYDLKELADGLASTPPDHMNSFLQQNVDVNNILNYWAATTILQNWDSIIKNHYLFHDTQSSGYWYMFPWDLDRTWGEYANWDLGARIPILAGMKAHPPGFGLPNDWWNRLIDALLKQPDFRDRYYYFIRTLLDDLFTVQRMNRWIDEQYHLIKDLVPQDRKKWGSQENWDFEEEIENCRKYVIERRVFLYESLPTSVEHWYLYNHERYDSGS